ncbi:MULTISPECIES: hypothetical protein [unclassified Streptococcus]|jgi:hypothetical protein|uniref:hypothetical protein n=1 Tax=unclassified Streptococcus TaxID=2608887 RepID=UPI0015BE8376|nr:MULTISPECIES: hypothetical protein [unclassified Streptococcus]MCP9015969.1 hypothetical protein [Streptococcus sp. CF8_St5-17]QLF55113.1 hypothetical protein HW271_02130 [Streptococcus sp. oral taxon 061]
MQEKKKASLVLSILSIIFAFGFPVLSIFLGVFGLVLANSYQKESGLDYKTEKILSILGIVLGIVISALICIVLISQLSGIH